MKKTLLWLDDARNPLEDDWLVFSPIGKDVHVEWVMTQMEFQDWIMINGLPDAICFDHDLGTGNGDGYECAKFLCEYCFVHKLPLPLYSSQSANAVGRENIVSYLENYKKHCELPKPSDG
jgi:hypothetical protein